MKYFLTLVLFANFSYKIKGIHFLLLISKKVDDFFLYQQLHDFESKDRGHDPKDRRSLPTLLIKQDQYMNH